MSTTTLADLVPLDNSDRIASHLYEASKGLVLPQSGVSTTDTRGVTYAPQYVTLTGTNILDLGTLFTNTAAHAGWTQADQSNPGFKGIVVVLNMTVNAGSAGSVTLEIDNKDTASGTYYSILTGAAVAAVTATPLTYTVYPGSVVSANVSANAALAPTWRIKVTANNANNTTFTVGGFLII